MTFDEYYEATDKKLMELSYTESDDFKRRGKQPFPYRRERRHQRAEDINGTMG